MKKKFRSPEFESFEEFRIPRSKRIFDILFAIFSLILFSPIMIFTSFIIMATSKGSVIYRSQRVGTGFDIFMFYKFRSMYKASSNKLSELSDLNMYLINKNKQKNFQLKEKCPECERLGYPCSPILYIDGRQICENFYLNLKRIHSKNATFFKIKNDPRVTPFGRFIRRTNIDELPQLFNVLKGDMSIVGNRPLPLYEAEMLTTDQWALRFLAPAGITGLWQIHFNKISELSETERKNLDNKYALNYSFWRDVAIIFKTIPVVFRSKEDL